MPAPRQKASVSGVGRVLHVEASASARSARRCAWPRARRPRAWNQPASPTWSGWWWVRITRRDRPPAERPGEQPPPRPRARRGVEAGVDERPAVAVVERIDVEVVGPERQRQPQPEHALGDLDRRARRPAARERIARAARRPVHSGREVERVERRRALAGRVAERRPPAAAAGGCGRRPAPRAARRPPRRRRLQQVVPAERQREGAQVGRRRRRSGRSSRPPPSSRSPRPAAAPPPPARAPRSPAGRRAVSSTSSISACAAAPPSGELAADHVHRLDAVGALVDRRHPHVAVELRDAGLLDVAHAAEDLHGERRDLAAGVGAEGLGDRRQERRPRRPGLLAGGRAPCRSRARSRGRSPAPSPPSPPWSAASAARRRGRGSSPRPSTGVAPLPPLAGEGERRLQRGVGLAPGPATPTPRRALFIMVNIAAMPWCGAPISQPVARVVLHHAGRAAVQAHLVLERDRPHAVRHARPAVGVGQELRHQEERDAPGARRARPAAAPAPGGRRSRPRRGRPRR